MIVQIIMTAEEKLLAEHYAKKHSLSLEEAFKRAVFEKIEEEYGINFDRNITDTVYLSSIPTMKEIITEGLNTPLDECLPESEIQW